MIIFLCCLINKPYSNLYSGDTFVGPKSVLWITFPLYNSFHHKNKKRGEALRDNNKQLCVWLTLR